MLDGGGFPNWRESGPSLGGWGGGYNIEGKVGPTLEGGRSNVGGAKHWRVGLLLLNI